MDITPVVADKCFSVLVHDLGTPDIEYLRWAFVRSVVELKVVNYHIDSNLGGTGRFNSDTPTPTVSCDKSELNPLRVTMIRRVNQAIRAITNVEPATKIKRIRIASKDKPVIMKISHEKSLEPVMRADKAA